MQLFARTPAPYDTESLLGYILRVAEENGYDSPLYVTQYAGFTSAERKSIRFPAGKLEPILGLLPGALAHLSYVGKIVNGVHEYALLGHVSGRNLHRNFLRFHHPEFCPQCVDENGFLDAFWDAELVVACPKHHRTVVSVCPSCSEPLSWRRQGLLTCHCGSSLQKARGSAVPSAVICLMEVLRHKIHGASLTDIDNTAGFPLREMEAIPLWSFFSMLQRLAAQNHLSRNIDVNDTPMAIVENAAEILQNWPHEYHAFLSRVGDYTGTLGLNAVGINVRFKSFYSSMFKSAWYRGECDFLKEEYTRFGLQHWGQSLVDKRSIGNGIADKKRFVSKAELAKYLNVTLTTIDNWMKQGLLQSQVVATTGKTKRHIVDVELVTLPRRTEGKTFGSRDAATFVGLPSQVLRELRKSGHYQVQNAASRLAAFHEKDLENFKSRLFEPVLGMEMKDRPDYSMISFQEVMENLKFGSPDRKARFVTEYLNGNILAVARCGQALKDIYFDRSAVMFFAEEERSEAAQGTYTVRMAAARLDCAPIVIYGLVDAKYLATHWTPRAERILKTSLAAFSAQYIALATVAKSQNTTSRSLAKIATRTGIELLIIPCRHKQVITYFLKREDESRLIQEVKSLEPI